MKTSVQALVTGAALSEDRAAALVRAIEAAPKFSKGGIITIDGVLRNSQEPPDTIKLALTVLLLRGELRARFIPYHMKCDKQVGPESSSAEELRSKADHGAFGELCQNCHNYIDGAADIVIRIVCFFAAVH